MSRSYDVIIVGAGMVGATLAVGLSQQPRLKIALIEAQLPPDIKTNEEYDIRVSALTRSSEFILKNLDIWSQLQPDRISAFTDMEVWETPTSTLHYDCADMNESCLGHLLENRHIQQAALAKCRATKNIDIITPAKPVNYQSGQLELDTGITLQAELIVAADGAHSLLRQWAAIETKGWSYQQQGLVCTVSTEQSHQRTAWQRFLPEGPLAFLPLPDAHQCSIVWTLEEHHAERLVSMSETDFLVELNQAFDNKLGQVTKVVSQRAAFPLKLRHAETYIQPGLALVGDAAHTIHPLAGQGVNIGFLDAATLAEVIIDAAEKGRQLGSLHTLHKYQRRRRADNIAMQLSMDAFKRIFCCQFAPVKWARQFGLKTVNHSALLKNMFMHQAAGREFSRPALTKAPISS